VSVKIDTYLPPGYNSSNQRYPLLFLLDGDLARSEGFFNHALDSLIGKSIQPVITVFVGEVKFGDLQIQDPVQYYDLIADFYGKEVLKYIDEHYRTKSEATERAIIGNGFNAPDAFMTTLKLPGMFGAIGIQSFFMLSSDEQMIRGLVKTAQEQPLQIYLDWGLYDLRTKRENWDIPETNRRMIQYLREKGYKPAGGETHEFFGWASWRNRVDRVLTTLFPLQ